MPKSPSIEVIARGLFAHQGRVLLCRNIKHGYYYLPGGHVEFGESARVALDREMQEECGQGVEVGPLLLTSEEHFDDGKKVHHEINLVFHMEQLGGMATPPDEVASQEDQIAFDWVELAQLHEATLYPHSIKAWLMSGGGVDPKHGPMISSFEHTQPD